jgi:hypothetical protein
MKFMIDELYDSILSITNQLGYIDKVSEVEDKNSLLRWSSNNLFQHSSYKIYSPNYPVKVFSHDELIKAPFSCIITEDGIINNLD